MYPLRELVHSTSLHRDYATTCTSLLSKLTELHIDVARADKDKGEIVVRCLTRLANAILWRCWSDKLVFEIKGIDAANTQVKIYAIPNLLRYRTRRSEEIIELRTLVSQLFIE